MAKEAIMYYRFTSDDEPKEEQLSLLMQKAREEVQKKNSNLQSVITENIRREYEKIKKVFPNL
jgi:guanylate kinase